MTRPSPFRNALHFLLRHVRRRIWLVVAVLTAAICGSVFAVGVQYGIKLLIDALTAPGKAALAPDAALAVFLVLVGLESLSWRAGGWLGSRAVIQIGADIQLDLFEHLTAQSLRYFGRQTTGSLANRIPAAADSVRSFVSTLIWNIVPPGADFIGSILVLGSVDWHFAAALIVSGIVTSAVIMVIGARGYPVHRAYYDEAARTMGDIADVISNNALMRTFNGRRRESLRLRLRLQSEMKAHQRSWLYLEVMRLMHDILLWVTTAGILIVALRDWRLGSITTGDVVIVITLSFRILNASREFALSSLGLGQKLGAIEQAVAVLTPPPDLTDKDGAYPLELHAGEIAMRDVSFSHDGREPVFRDFFLHIPAGQRLGIVGPSGAGKSTLLRLLQRHDDPEAGEILIDGQPIGEVTQYSLTEALAVVSQDTAMFHRSVIDNIRYGRPEASRAEVMMAAKAAQCDEFIRALPDQYETLVGERGASLSGGQRQRIAIARAILKDAPIILLDEATSALDGQSEIAVQKALVTLTEGRTVIAVAHRLSTVMSFDRIIVLEDGMIVEDGAPAELRRGDGPFARMWMQQQSREAGLPLEDALTESEAPFGHYAELQEGLAQG